MKYYFLADKIKPKTAFAYAKNGTRIPYELVPLIKDMSRLPFDFELKSMKKNKDGFLASNDLTEVKHFWIDFQPNNYAWPLMSEKFKAVIDKNIKKSERIGWIKTKIYGNNEEKEYYILKFTTPLDVLNERKTIFAEGTNHIVKPVFSFEKIKDLNIFYRPKETWQVNPGIYVSESLKRAIQKEKITGVDFEETAVSE